MARDLQATSPASLPAIDVRQPSSLLLLPDWLSQQLGAVSDLGAGRTTIDRSTGAITSRVPTIPKSLMPTGPQRTAITRRVAELEAATRAGPDEDLLHLVGEIITEWANARIDDKVSAIKSDAYMDAVEDLPYWAVREAVRRWRRGEVTGVPLHDFDFAPKPARLRLVAEGIAIVAKGQLLRLRRVLAAEAEEPLTDAEREANQTRYAGVLKQLAAPVIEPGQREPVARDPNLTTDLESRRIRREAREAEHTSDEPVPHSSHEETESAR